MSYTPTEWETGQTITAEKLNKLEQGVADAGGGLVVTITDGVMNKTYNEIKQALQSGPVVCVAERDGALFYNNIVSSADGDNDRTPNILFTYDAMDGTPAMYIVYNGDGYPEFNDS